MAGCREGPETIQRQREKERQRAGGKEQRSEKVESTRDVKNCVSVCVCVRVHMCVCKRVIYLPADARASSRGWLLRKFPHAKLK